jgi:type II secretory pathway component GspD/PulD (secretin)
MDLVNVTLQKALALVVTTNKLKYGIQGNTMIVTSADDDSIDYGAGSKDIIIVPVKYVSAASIADFLNKSIFSKTSISPGVSSKPVVTTNPANNELIIMGTQSDALMAQKIIEQFDKKPPITNYKVNHVTPAEMAGLICSTLIPSFMSNGEGSTGGAAGVPTGFASDTFGGGSSGSGDSLSIGGGKLLCSVDQKASADDLSSLPFKNMTVSYFPTIGMVQIIGGSPTQLEMIKDYIAANDIKSPQAYLEVQIISLSESGSKTFDNTWQYMSKSISFNASNGIRTASSGGGQNYPIFLTGHGFSEQAKGTGQSTSKEDLGDIKYSQWSQSPQLIWTINYLVENNKGRVLANPRILITNGQQSVIDLTSDYVAKVTSQYLDSTGTGSSQVQKDYDIQSDNGIKVTITPFISPDGYVTMDINPDYSTIAGQLYTDGQVEGQRDLAATLLQRRNLTLKGIRIKDGETLIIGGMIQETETKSVSKIPFLGDLPFIGMFFRSTGTQRSKEEMVIMLTPQIIVDTEDATEITDLDL